MLIALVYHYVATTGTRLMTFERRSFKRLECLWPATLLHRGIWHDCFVVDISINGAKIRHLLNNSDNNQGLFDQNEEIFLNLGNYGAYGGSVIWTNKKYIGMIFTDPPEIIRHQTLGPILSNVESCQQK